MNILHLSDTHGRHGQLAKMPDADVVVHSGDFTWAGSEQEVVEFMEWFCGLPYRHKVLVAGNHDDCLYGAVLEGLPDGTHYLYNTGVTLDGMRFFGVPMFMLDDMGGRYDRMLADIPADTDILITHQPPSGILDESHGRHYGSKVLRERLQVVKPRLHLFGHIHDAWGKVQSGGTLFANSSVLNERYELTHLPQMFSIGTDAVGQGQS